MKYYFIHSKVNNSFLGYTTEKKLLKLFLEQRGRDLYKIIIIDEEELNPKLIKQLKENYKYLDLFKENYGITVIFAYEEDDLVDKLLDYASDLNNNIIKLLKLIPYIKFTNDEKETVFNGLEIIERMGQDVKDEECCVEFEEYFNMTKILREKIGIK